MSGSPTESDQEDRVAVAYQDPNLQQNHQDRPPPNAMPVSQPKFKVHNFSKFLKSLISAEGFTISLKNQAVGKNT